MEKDYVAIFNINTSDFPFSLSFYVISPKCSDISIPETNMLFVWTFQWNSCRNRRMYRMRRRCTTTEAGCRRVRICKGPRDPLQLQGVLQREVDRRRRVHQGVARRRPPGLRSSATCIASCKRHDVVDGDIWGEGGNERDRPWQRHLHLRGNNWSTDSLRRSIRSDHRRQRARWNNPVTS